MADGSTAELRPSERFRDLYVCPIKRAAIEVFLACADAVGQRVSGVWVHSDAFLDKGRELAETKDLRVPDANTPEEIAYRIAMEGLGGLLSDGHLAWNEGRYRANWPLVLNCRRAGFATA